MSITNYLPIINSIIGVVDDSTCFIDSKGKIVAFNDRFSNNFHSSFNKNISIGDTIPENLVNENELTKLCLRFAKSSDCETLKTCDETNTKASFKPLILSNEFVGIVCKFKEMKKNVIDKSEEKFISLFEQASDSIMITDFRGYILDANASFCNLFGYSKDQLLNTCIRNLIDQDELTERPLRFDNLSEGQRVFSLRKMIHKDGRTIYVEANLKKFAKNQILAIVKDITEIKNALTQIEISEAQFKGAFENTAIGMALVSQEGKWMRINKEFCSMLGYEEHELFQLSFKDITHPEDFPNCIINILKIIQGEIEAWRTEKRYQHKNGKYLWINFNASMVRDSKNNPLFLVSHFENITERKEGEIQREKMTKDLLLQNKNLEQFAYIVSHNLRAPVANLIGLSSLLKDEAYPPEIRNQCINELETSSQRLDDIIHDLNNILQIKREITEKKEEVHFSILVEHIQSSIQNIIHKEQVRISSDFSAIESVTTLKSYLYSIFFNLITNSIKYRHAQRTPLITISSELVNNKIILHFSDNGMGVDMEKYGEHLFGLYKRFHLQIEGKGMGLFVVKTQVETLGGTISANSTINEGLQFRIELPR